MEIETEGRRTLIQPKWNRYNLQENLQKIGLSLTSIHAATGQQISIIDSLATCLIQHASNGYDGISNLDEAWESVISKETKEEDWMNQDYLTCHLKEMKLKRLEEVEDDAEVTRTLSLHDVYKDLEEWKESLGSELSSQCSKGCLIPIKAQEVK